MTNLVRWFKLICCVGAIYVSNIQLANALQLRISPNKVNYLVREWIDLRVTLINDSRAKEEILPLDMYMRDHLKIVVRGKGGGQLPYRCPATPLHLEHPIPLLSGDSVVTQVALLDIFRESGRSDSGGVSAFSDPIITSGEYEVQAIYVPRSVQSNKVTLKIMDPKGSESEAFRLVEQAWYYRRKDVHDAQSSLFFSQVVKKYPQSVYAPFAQYMVIRSLVPGTLSITKQGNEVQVDRNAEALKWAPESALSQCKFLLENYPDFPENEEIVHMTIRCYWQLNNMEEGKRYLRVLADKTPNQHLRSAIHMVLKEFEEGKLLFK